MFRTMTNRSGRHSASRHALRRVMGIVVLALFARQTTALASVGCNGAHHPASSPMATMDHQAHGDAPADMPDAPVPSNDSGCDHSAPASACGLSGGCLVAVAAVPVATDVPRSASLREFPAPAVRDLAPEFAPDTPPPRA